MNASWEKIWRSAKFQVEIRSSAEDRGATLRIGSISGDAEWLRFDCFERAPHWHIDPRGRDEKHPLDERDDPVGRVIAMIEHDLPALLARADAPESLLAGLAVPGEDDATQGDFLLDLERALRHRPIDLDELDLRQLQSRRSEKWHTYPRDVLPAWVAEMDFPIAAPIQAELRRFSESSDVGYPLGLRETGLPDVFCQRMAERFDWHPDAERVEILSEVVQGMYLSLEAFSAPGEGAIVQTPIYPPFLHAVRDTRRRLVENRLQVCESGLAFDLDGLARAIDRDTRVLLLCNPHNPSGRVLGRAELERLAGLVLEHDLVVISDEIHGDLLFDDRLHIPFATLSPEIAARTVTLTSASKAFNIPGLRCAVAHFGSEALQSRFNTVVPRHFRGGIGLFGIHATIAAWRWGQPWLDAVRAYLQANRDFAEAALAERIPEIRFVRPEATYLAWLDCSGLELTGRPAAYFLRHGRVALSEGRLFGPGWEAYARLNFATSRPILAEVIDRMAKALGR